MACICSCWPWCHSNDAVNTPDLGAIKVDDKKISKRISATKADPTAIPDLMSEIEVDLNKPEETAGAPAPAAPFAARSLSPNPGVVGQSLTLLAILAEVDKSNWIKA
jgi:hypothetical protein